MERPTVTRSVLIGTFGFALVSLAGFSVWAFAGQWFYQTVGEAGLYAVSAVVFVGVAGLLLNPLVEGGHRIWRFYKAFVPAFLAYSIVWSLCWFLLKSGKGEWLGSFLGCVAFAWLLGRSLGSTQELWKVILVLFAGHSAGYFLGGIVFVSKSIPDLLQGLSRQQIGLIRKMLWGLLYGLGFGAGIGYAFYAFQRRLRPGTQSDEPKIQFPR
jgi:hypothetical protein